MSDLAAQTVTARHNAPVYNNTAADAGAECYKNNIVMPFSAALPHFSKRRDICIVSHITFNAAAQKL